MAQIDSLSNKRLLDGVLPGKAAAKGNGKIENGSDNSSADDSVSITSVGQGLTAGREAGASTAAVNEEKVAAISNALQSGRYMIDPERVAQKILQLDRQLPNSS